VPGVNAGAGLQIPLSDVGFPYLRFEALYNAVGNVNPANFVSLSLGIKLFFA